jgi:Predicted signal transduction protein with a C-terminal ATPase domain
MQKTAKKKGLSLHRVLLSMFLVSIGIVLLFLVIALVPKTTDLLQRNAVDRTKETVLQGVKSLDLFVDNLLSSLNYATTLLPSDMDAADEGWKERLSFMDMSREDISALALFDKEGALLYATSGQTALKSDKVAAQPFFQKAIERQGTALYFSLPHMQNLFSGQRSYVLSVSRSVEYMRGGQIQTGVMLMDVEYSSLRTLIERITLGQSGYAYLLDESDRLVCHPYEQRIDSGLMTEDITAVSKSLLGVTQDSAQGKERVLIAATVNKTRWRLVGVAYFDEITTLESAFIRIFSVVLLGAALIAFACAAMASHFVTRPIIVVERTMQKVIGGNLNVSLNETGFREIRSVSSAFNHMLSRIRALMSQILVEQETKRLHELNALQAQINPHFLYNTLDSIIWMEERGRGKEAIKMVSALAKLFRIAISRGKPMIKVEEELEHVRNYLIIQKMRFKDKFAYTLEATEEALREATVKLIVQPIVENCINHAIDQISGEELHIDIRAFTDENNLIFTVRDDGVGIAPEQMPELLTQNAGTSGIGLKNVHERIMLTYGSAYGISVDSHENEYTLVTITLPKGKGDDK